MISSGVLKATWTMNFSVGIEFGCVVPDPALGPHQGSRAAGANQRQLERIRQDWMDPPRPERPTTFPSREASHR